MTMRFASIISACGLALALSCAIPAQAIVAGAAAPAFALPDIAGRTISLQELRGQVVYVDFWASWCGPCRRSFPWMNAMTQKYGAQGFKVIAVNVDKKRTDADRFLAQVPAHFTTVFDAAGVTPTAYDVKGMPSAVLIDASGNVVSIDEGFRDDAADALEARIRTLLPKR